MKKGCAALGSVILTMLLGCGTPPPPAPVAEPEIMFLRSPLGVAVVETGATEAAFRGSAAVPTRDWSTIVSTDNVKGGSTRVSALDPSTGTARWSQVVPGGLSVKIASEDGGVAVLGPTSERHHLRGRSETELTIVRTGQADEQSLTLKGNYEPEAFSTDGRNLFVIRYLPSQNPTKYQVRRLDLTDGRVKSVYTPDQHLQRAMGGTARIQVGSPDGTRLYTLYTVGRGSDRYAFIHVLDLDQLWAHCIDLPKEFARSAEFATALSVSPDGTKLHVGNGAAQAVAEIDTQELAVTRSESVSLSAGRQASAASSESSFYFANGNEVTAVDTAALQKENSWDMLRRITGLQVTGGAKRLLVGLRDKVVAVDLSTGEIAETIDPPGVKRIYQFGPTMSPVEDTLSDRRVLKCAC
ncbi:MAG: hypothetical protein M3285_03340 [Actinomycetota bacterium]|nr:hypothetical protein [Actinomycetota bacterium]